MPPRFPRILARRPSDPSLPRAPVHPTFAFTLRSLAPRALNLPNGPCLGCHCNYLPSSAPHLVPHRARVLRGACAERSPSPPFPLLQLQLELRLVAGREALRRALLAMVPQIDELQKKRELMKQQQQAQQRQQARP